MRTVDLYLRRAKECSRFAREAGSTKTKAEFRAAARAWKSLADHRVELLHLQEQIREQAEKNAAPRTGHA